MQRKVYFFREYSPDCQIITESATENKEKKYYIEGVFSTADKANRNKRIYPYATMQSAIDTYINESVKTNRAIGAINHPDSPIPDPRTAAILIEKLEWEGKQLIGKASVMSTPEGQILKSLIESGYKGGISSRATGSLKAVNGLNEVQDDLEFFAYDFVHNPSNYDSMVEGLMEGEIWIPKGVVESIEPEIDSVKKSNKKELQKRKQELIEAFFNTLSRS